MPIFVEIEEREGCFYVHLSFGVKKKRRRKSDEFQEPISQKQLKQFTRMTQRKSDPSDLDMQIDPTWFVVLLVCILLVGVVS